MTGRASDDVVGWTPRSAVSGTFVRLPLPGVQGTEPANPIRPISRYKIAQKFAIATWTWAPLRRLQAIGPLAIESLGIGGAFTGDGAATMGARQPAAVTMGAEAMSHSQAGATISHLPISVQRRLNPRRGHYPLPNRHPIYVR